MTSPQIQPIVRSSRFLVRKGAVRRSRLDLRIQVRRLPGPLYLEQRSCRFVSRRRNTLSRFGELCDDIAAEIAVNNAILDGEVIASDETGWPVYLDLIRRTRRLVYVAFDLLWLNGADLLSLPLRERLWRLRGILPKGSPAISEALAVQGRDCGLFEPTRSPDLEAGDVALIGVQAIG